MFSAWHKFWLRIVWNSKSRSFTLSFLRLFPIRQGRVMCLCWNGNNYGCNPKAITDTIAANSQYSDHLDVWFAFTEPSRFSSLLPKSVHSVEIGTFEYYRLLYSSQFVISNIHCSGQFYPYKKKLQTYIFTGHGGSGIKKIEFDADSLSEEYLRMAAEDTSRIDLFLSGSSFRSKVIRSAYRYSGEILEKGTPRNDSLFETSKKNAKDNCHFLIYCPTFRNNGRRDVYGFDIDALVSALETKFGGEWYIRISSHPNMRHYYKEIYDFSHPRLIDVGQEDLQKLLLSSDVLITDYSSAEMDFALFKRPIFQLCRDRKDYDRGFYINPEELPFPYAETDEELIANVINFDNDKYLKDLEKFNKEVIGLKETGHAAEAVVEWMISKVR